MRSIFGEGEQIKDFKVFNRICNILLRKGLSRYISCKFITYWNIIELKFDAIDLIS